ncbi:MAG: rRNA maturation RNAse YbeY [Desulfovibrionaceae bacterium]|nr:rRNA maturation RNAse YbeY [Desulfovibrionaceae bacterium]
MTGRNKERIFSRHGSPGRSDFMPDIPGGQPLVAVNYEFPWLKPLVPLSRREMTAVIEKMSTALVALHPNAPLRVDCLICSDACMENLNRNFLGAPGPTNTLAFESGSDDIVFSSQPADYQPNIAQLSNMHFPEGSAQFTGFHPFLHTPEYQELTVETTEKSFYTPQQGGQLYFCAPQYARELLLYGQNPEEYAVFLLSHALTHLTGLDHGAEMDGICERLIIAAQS